MQEHSTFFGALATKAHEHRLRCKKLPPMRSGEAERLVADFLATRDITACPPRYAAPVEQRLPGRSKAGNSAFSWGRATSARPRRANALGRAPVREHVPVAQLDRAAAF